MIWLWNIKNETTADPMKRKATLLVMFMKSFAFGILCLPISWPMLLLAACYKPRLKKNIRPRILRRMIIAACSSTPTYPAMIAIASKAHHSKQSIIAEGMPSERYS